ncbi:hypothetical protein ACFXP7_03675 [Microbacterium sp. P06]|uniref:hypothetical protein n=1 Tax=unclassified Microbacterium TaxID=2609290 RepID=UPI0037475829
MTADGAPTGASGTPAEEVLEARLEPSKMTAAKRLARNALAFVVSSVSGGGGDDLLPGLDLVVTRRDTGAEVLRVRAGQFEEAGHLLEHTWRDLAQMTVEQFVRSWRVIDE